MTFLELQQSVYQDTGYASTPSSVVSGRVKNWLNEAQRHVLRRPEMTDLRQGTLTFTSASGQAIYGLPQAFERMDYIVQQTNNIRLRMMSRDQYRLVDPGERSSGMPGFWVPVGLVPYLQPPASTGLWAVSSTADTANVVMQGIRASGDLVGPVTTALTNTSRVQLGTITDFVEVMSLTLSAVAAGTISIFDAATNGNLIARIPIGAKSIQYQGIRLWPTPTAAIVYTIDGQYLIPTLTNDTDIPLMPPSYHDVLSAYARMKEYERTNDPRYPKAQTEYEQGVTRLRIYAQFPADFRPISGSMNNVGWNDLGAWYPSDFNWP